jgi:CRISPR type IV-associated protein Csf1
VLGSLCRQSFQAIKKGCFGMFGHLFAAARGVLYENGTERCFYCGSACGTSYTSKQYVKDSFTSRDTVCGGDFVCAGCVQALNENATIRLPDGTVRESQKTRCYSWVFSSAGAIAATKAHREWLTGICLMPPEPPFVICLSDSGQKHLLYRSAVCHSREVITVTLEGMRVTFRPEELQERISLVVAMVAAVGKPALDSPLTFRQQMTVVETHSTDRYLQEWNASQASPLSALALWLSPAKKEAEIEYKRNSSAGQYVDGAVSADARGVD